MSSCRCSDGTPTPASAKAAQSVTLPLAEINRLVDRAKVAFTVAAGELTTPVQELLHATPAGDRLHSVSYIDAPGRGRVTYFGHVRLGHVRLLPVQFVQRVDANEAGLIH